MKEGERVVWRNARCTRQSALIAARNAKFPSSLTRAGRFTAEIAGLKEDNREDQKEDPLEDTKHSKLSY
jgi:hypothetical protein